MFIKAVETNLKYTRPLLTGRLIYKTFEISNGISSLIVLNHEGDILTCHHVAELFMIAEETNEVYLPILKEMQGKSIREISKIEKKYGINEGAVVALHNILVDVAENPGKLNIIKHPTLDLAIIKITNKKQVLVNSFPVFRTSNPVIGENICKLGFAFPEYDTFYYDDKNKCININNKIMNFPSFPLDGMVTRGIVDSNNDLSMFEISTPCLPGQSGGPIFDQEGLICGVQVGTKRITSIYTNEMPFNLDLGIGINVKSIVSFLDENQIKYNKSEK